MLDKLTYAGNLANLADVAADRRFTFVRADIADREAVAAVFREHRPSAVINFAAESHVDRSIDDPADFVRTNVVGAFELLEAARRQLAGSDPAARERFRFLHVSTDEVYGSLGPTGAFCETTPYEPNSPYSASKAGADHLVRAYHATYGVPALITNCSNNYGPYQFPEKLIPLMLLNALEAKPLPIYGDGRNVRDWLYVEDHCAGILLALERGRPGEKYNLGGFGERANVEIVDALCAELERHPSRRRESRARARGRRRVRGPQALRRRSPRTRPALCDRLRARAEGARLAPRARPRGWARGDRAVVSRPPRLVRGGAVGPLPARAARARARVIDRLRGGMLMRTLLAGTRAELRDRASGARPH